MARTPKNTRSELALKVQSAHILGQIAFANGGSCVPCQDIALMELLSSMAVGTGASEVMKDWIKGWTEMCLIQE